MADLQYNTEMMRACAQRYRDVAVNMVRAKDDLKMRIDGLKDKYWKSDAGKSFMAMYEDDWCGYVDKYTAVMIEMASQLDKAADDYDRVTLKLKSVPDISV